MVCLLQIHAGEAALLEPLAELLGQDVVPRWLGHASPCSARHSHAPHLGPVAERLAYAARQLAVRHPHLAGLNPHRSADGGQGEDARPSETTVRS
jgi:hypothetical protein